MATFRWFRPDRPLPTTSLILSLVFMGICTAFVAGTRAQSPLPQEFEVVSIKRVEGRHPGGGFGILPDGTVVMTNQPLNTLMPMASPVRVALLGDIVGVPEWMKSEPYDVTAKPPTGWTREQLMPAYAAMWRAFELVSTS